MLKTCLAYCRFPSASDRLTSPSLSTSRCIILWVEQHLSICLWFWHTLPVLFTYLCIFHASHPLDQVNVYLAKTFKNNSNSFGSVPSRKPSLCLANCPFWSSGPLPPPHWVPKNTAYQWTYLIILLFMSLPPWVDFMFLNNMSFLYNMVLGT